MTLSGFGIEQIQRGRFVIPAAVAEWDPDAAANFKHLKELIYIQQSHLNQGRSGCWHLVPEARLAFRCIIKRMNFGSSVFRFKGVCLFILMFQGRNQHEWCSKDSQILQLLHPHRRAGLERSSLQRHLKVIKPLQRRLHHTFSSSAL